MPKTIPMSVKRDWLEKYENGTSEPQLARKYKRDTRTIKKGIEDARRERVSSQARADLVKEALRNHNQHLLSILAELQGLIEVPPSNLSIPWEKQFESGTFKFKGGTASYSDLISPNTIKIVLDIENKPEWKLIEEHFKRDPILKWFNQWKKSLVGHFESRIHLKILLGAKLEENTGYKLAKDSSSGSIIFTDSFDILFGKIMLKLLYPSFKDNLGANINIDKEKGHVRYGSSILAHSPGKEVQCKNNIIKSVEQVSGDELAANVKSSYKAVEDASIKLVTNITEVSLMGLVPGQCHICGRLGL